MDGVCLTTAHSAKGLEWPISYVIQTKFHGKNKDERLRLLFVAVTRARDELIITGTRQLNRSKEDPLFNTDLQHICHHLGVSFAALPTEADS
jgi:superfamily I DNA/RNA helicase